MIRLLAVLLSLIGMQAQAEKMRLAVTTSFHNSGLSDVLLPAILEETGVEVQLLVVGTGQALRLGEAGDVDAILVHSKAAEEAFVANGFGTHRREIMYNDFMFVGPSADPAMVREADTAITALKRMRDTKSAFVSRGDNSGTHKKEMSLWAAASLNPSEFDPWYKAVGASMGASLNTAAGLNAYIMTDRASWLNFGNKQGLTLLFSGDPALFNQYAYIQVNPKRHPHVKTAEAAALEAWLTSDRAQELIDGYEVGGQQLFTFNAGP